MTTSVFPSSLAGLGYKIPRQVMWSTDVQESIAGLENRLSYYVYPKYSWKFNFSILRSNNGYTELQTLLGFYNQMQGQYNTFLYTDPDDNTVSSQLIATADGVTVDFQLVKSFGGFIEPVFAPNLTKSFIVYFNGTAISSGAFGVQNWGTVLPGNLTFSSAPSSGTVITASFSYYYPCRFSADKQEFTLNYYGAYSAASLSIESVKN